MSHFYGGRGEEVASNLNDFNIIWGEDAYTTFRPEWCFCLKLTAMHVYSYILKREFAFKKKKKQICSPYYQTFIQHPQSTYTKLWHLHFVKWKTSPVFCLQALDSRVCSVTEAADRSEGVSPTHSTQWGRAGRRGSVEASVLSLVGLWEARSNPCPAGML